LTIRLRDDKVNKLTARRADEKRMERLKYKPSGENFFDGFVSGKDF
jgi:hypothetical protein